MFKICNKWCQNRSKKNNWKDFLIGRCSEDTLGRGNSFGLWYLVRGLLIFCVLFLVIFADFWTMIFGGKFANFCWYHDSFCPFLLFFGLCYLVGGLLDLLGSNLSRGKGFEPTSALGFLQGPWYICLFFENISKWDFLPRGAGSVKAFICQIRNRERERGEI